MKRRDQVDELARLCGYLPLALRAVASALQEKKNISPADYANRLRDGKHLVLKEIDPSLQKSVGAALQSSYELLADDLRQKFRFLSVFPDTFDQAAAAAVWEVSLETAQDSLGELLAYSLVEFDEITKRYGLHDLVRVFAGQLLSPAEVLETGRRYARHYEQVLDSANALYLRGGEFVVAGLALFDMEWDNIQAAWNWLVGLIHEDESFALWCCQYSLKGAYCLQLRRPPDQRIRWFEMALAAARLLKNSAFEAASLGNIGLAHRELGDFRQAIMNYEQVLRIPGGTETA